MSITDQRLDRRIPSTRRHIQMYPASALKMITKTVANVERLMLPPTPSRYQVFYDQGQEGACVGFGESLLMSLYNRRLYDAFWLYRQAQDIDEYNDTPPAGGTSLSAGFDVLRTKGHRRIYNAKSMPAMIEHGIVAVNRWVQTVDEGRTSIAEGHPMADGIAWFNEFYKPIEKTRKLSSGRVVKEYWIPEPDAWGPLVGYHCICRAGASDQRESFQWLNSWGPSYPWPVNISYKSHEKLMTINGESALVTDR